MIPRPAEIAIALLVYVIAPAAAIGVITWCFDRWVP